MYVFEWYVVWCGSNNGRRIPKTRMFKKRLDHVSLYSLIWDFLLSQFKIWTTTTWSNVWVVLCKPSWYEILIGFLIWTPPFKVFASYNILQYLCDFIHVLIFVTVSKCRRSPNLTNIVICAQNIITILGSRVNMIGDLYDHLMFTLKCPFD